MAVKIFLVEDNPLIRANLIEHFEELLPAEVVGWAATEEDALKWLRSGKTWDIAVIDLFLVKGSGMGVVAGLVGRGPDQMAVVLSNYATHEIRIRAVERGADAVFDKSQEIDEFVAFVQSRMPS